MKAAAALLMSFVLGSVLLHGQPRRTASDGALTLGILREDTVLVPFAVLSGGTWTTPWPAPSVPPTAAAKTRGRQPLSTVPAAWWGGREPQLDWELLRATGDRHPISAVAVRDYQNQCTSSLGLATDYTSPIVIQRDSYPLPYAGIVSTSAGVLDPVVRLAKGDADVAAIQRELPALLRAQETALWRAEPADGRPDLTGALPAPTLTVYAGFLPDGRRLLYADARRELTRRADGTRIERATLLHAWFSRAPGQPAVTLRQVRAERDTDGMHGSSFGPLAAATINGRTYWIGPRHLYEREDYVVVDVTDDVPHDVATAVAGGC